MLAKSETSAMVTARLDAGTTCGSYHNTGELSWAVNA